MSNNQSAAEYLAQIRDIAATLPPGVLANVEGVFTHWRAELSRSFDIDEFGERDLQVAFVTLMTTRSMAQHLGWEQAEHAMTLMIASTPHPRDDET